MRFDNSTALSQHTFLWVNLWTRSILACSSRNLMLSKLICGKRLLLWEINQFATSYNILKQQPCFSHWKDGVDVDINNISTKTSILHECYTSLTNLFNTNNRSREHSASQKVKTWVHFIGWNNKLNLCITNDGTGTTLLHCVRFILSSLYYECLFPKIANFV